MLIKIFLLLMSLWTGRNMLEMRKINFFQLFMQTEDSNCTHLNPSLIMDYAYYLPGNERIPDR